MTSHPRLRVHPPKDRTKYAIIAVDPGPGCGIATYHPWPAIPGMNFDTETLELEDDGHLWLNTRLRQILNELCTPTDDPIAGEAHAVGDVIMVCEKFEFRKDDADQRDKIDFKAGEYVGVAVLTAMMQNISYHLQGASEVKKFWTDNKLRKLELWDSGQSRHERDALRHLLKYMTFGLQQQWLLDGLNPKVPASR